jgi:hypothetical protein
MGYGCLMRWRLGKQGNIYRNWKKKWLMVNEWLMVNGERLMVNEKITKMVNG